MFAVIVVASGHGCRHQHCHHHRYQHQAAVAILVVIIAISAGSFLAVLLMCWVVLFTFSALFSFAAARLTFVYFFWAPCL